jgi:hypothetical protein
MNSHSHRAGADSDASRLAYILEVLERPDPDAAVRAAGMALARARDAGSGGLRQQHLAEAQAHIARIDPRRQGRAVQQLQGQVLALQGRRGDTRLAHVTPGEVVIPQRLQTPAVMGYLAAAARAAGLDPRSLLVGHPAGKINPRTGQQEFWSIIGASDDEDNPGWDVTGDEGDFDPGDYDGWDGGEGPDGGSDGPIETVTVTAPRDHTDSFWQNLNPISSANAANDPPGPYPSNQQIYRGIFAPSDPDVIKGLSDENLYHYQHRLEAERAFQKIFQYGMGKYAGPLGEAGASSAFRDLDPIFSLYAAEFARRGLQYP